jgi:hypothetical protein
MEMGMIFCRGCGKQIHDTAQACPHCGAPQVSISSSKGSQKSPSAINNKVNDGPIWMSITSMIIGILCLFGSIAFSEDTQLDTDGITGCLTVAVAGLVIGAISISKQTTGKKMALAGVVLSAISILLCIGMLLPS